MKIIPLSEGAFTIDSTKEFVPFNKDVDDLQARPIGSLLVEIQPFLVITEKENILIDTGLGFLNDNGKLQIHANLASHDLLPGDISIVLLSHLHKDHSSGISYNKTTGEDKELSFPNATYYVNKDEYLAATTQASSSYVKDAYKILEGNPKVIFTENEGTIEGFIHYKVSGGHSQHHQVFWIKENGQTVFFGGDVAPQLQQMKSRFIAKYDFDGRRSMEMRKEWWEEGQKNGWKFLFYHDIKSPSIQL